MEWGPLKGTCSTYIQEIEGFKIGFFGVTTHECTFLSHPGDSILVSLSLFPQLSSIIYYIAIVSLLPVSIFDILLDINFLPVIQTSIEAVETLKKAGAEVIIAITHQAFAEDIELAKKVHFPRITVLAVLVY